MLIVGVLVKDSMQSSNFENGTKKEFEKLTLMRTISAASTATSVPEPMAIPTSAWARAGESLTPSPIMATFTFDFCNCFIFFTLWDGKTSAKTVVIPVWKKKKRRCMCVWESKNK